MGLDRDGTLFVDIDTGIRLYDLCFDTPLPGEMRIFPEDLMSAQNRQLYPESFLCKPLDHLIV